MRNAELRYGATQLECLAVVWALEKLHYYLEGKTFELGTDCQAVQSLLGMKTPNRHMFRWQLAIQEYRGRMTITHRPGRNHQNADLLSRFPLPNDASNPGGVDDVDIIEIFGLHVVDLASEFYKQITDSYQKCKNLRTLVKILSDETNPVNPQLFLSLDKDIKTCMTVVTSSLKMTYCITEKLVVTG